MMILTVGLLALAGSASLVTRLSGEGARQAAVATIAQARIERLRSVPCSAVAGGQDTVRGVVSQWTTQSITRGQSVTLSVQFASVRGTRSQSFRTILPC